MQPKTWYLGPLGDLRPLMCPAEGIKRPIERFGGVHQSLSGARTMDITGHRASYELTLPWLSPSESRFVEALHHRTVPGPFWLLDPIGTNRLSRDAAVLRPYSADVVATSGGTARGADYPDAIDVPITSLEWSSYAPGASITLPGVPMLAEETVTGSVWARTADRGTVTVTVTILGRAGEPVAEQSTTVTLDETWQHLAVSVTPDADAPATAAAARMALTAEDGTRISLAAAQLEPGSAAGAWDLGGGAPCVLIDQVGRSSPNYPRNDLAVTLLEV